MSDGNNRGHQIYPKRYFDASATWFAWNKLTARDVHELREEKGFEGQGIYFYLNHPIQYVRLVGIISGVESVANAKFTLVTLDDCSGANIEVKIKARDLKPNDAATYPSNTEVDNLDIQTSMGLPRIFIDGHPASVGTVIRAQGTISNFRNTRQLLLKRVWIVKDTTEEVALWSKTAEWKRKVLATPWILTEEQRAAFDEEVRRREVAERVKAEEKRKRSSHREKKRAKYLEKREAKRKIEETEMDAGALEGSSIVRMPWTDIRPA